MMGKKRRVRCAIGTTFLATLTMVSHVQAGAGGLAGLAQVAPSRDPDAPISFGAGATPESAGEGSSAAPADADANPDEPATKARGPGDSPRGEEADDATSTGLFVRFAGELGAATHAQWVEGEVQRPGYSARFEERQRLRTVSWGGRVQLGAALGTSRQVGIVPRLSGTLGIFEPREMTVTLAGRDLTWFPKSRYWSFGVGSEFQFIERMFFIGIEGGYGRLDVEVGDRTPSDLVVQVGDVEGFLGRIDCGLRFPGRYPFGGGVQLAMETVLSFDHPSNRRFIFGVFFEFDGGRG